MSFIADIGSSIPVEMSSQTATGAPANSSSGLGLVRGGHPSLQVLIAFNTRQLGRGERRQVYEHVRSCRGCQEMLANLPLS